MESQGTGHDKIFSSDLLAMRQHLKATLTTLR